MSGSIAITPIAPPATSVPAPSAATTAPPAADTASAASASKRPLVNPSLHLDLALNLVVLQFVDDKGEVTDSIPSAKQLKAYRDHDADGGTGHGVRAP